MRDMLESNGHIDGFSETRDRKYQTYIPGDTRIEGFCTFNELKARVEYLEKMLLQVCEELNAVKQG